MKTKEERADNYVTMQYIDYGDLSYQAEEQIREAYLTGYEKAEKLFKPKWISVEEQLPEEDVETLCCVLNKWVDELSKHAVLRYFQGYWYGDITEDEAVEKWMKIPR